jgi:hypothetical protein
MPEPQRVVLPALGTTAAAQIAVSAGLRNISTLPALRMLRRHPDTADDLRKLAKDEALRFNQPNVWLPLAVALEKIRHDRAYKRWGFRSLNAYAEDELDITKGTASDLFTALDYVMSRHPDYLPAGSSTVEHSPLPPYSSIAALARNSRFLPQPEIVLLDELLFAGQLTRKALQERIARAKGGRKSWQPGRPPRRSSVQPVRADGRDSLMKALEALFDAIDLDDLWSNTTAVFKDWGTDNPRERWQLRAQLRELIKRLTTIEELLEAEEE